MRELEERELNEDESRFFEWIYSSVRKGFTSVPEMELNITEDASDYDSVSLEWVVKTIHEEYQKLVEESSGWSHPTHTERLVQAFDVLCRQNIVALHGVVFTHSDGEYAAAEIDQELRQRNRPSDGYCFYHDQNLEAALEPTENPGLWIAFGKVDNDDPTVVLEVGRKVAQSLRDSGLTVDWNEDVTKKIHLPKFRWQHVYRPENRDLLDESAVAEMIIEHQTGS